MKNFLLLMMALVIMGSCSSEDSALFHEEGRTENILDSESVSEALESAEQMYESLFGKTNSGLRVKNIKRISPRTRGAGQDIDRNLYIVNYGEGKGFAILCDNPQSLPVIAISNEGSLSPEDIGGNEGISWYLDNIGETMALSSIWNPVVPVDTNLQTIVNPVVRRTEYSKPLLKGLPTKLHQFSPFNRLCPSLTGCTPLACGTVMAYHKWPASYSGHTWNWNAMLSDENNYDWCWLFKYLGDKDNCQTYYFRDVAVSDFDNIVRTFSNFGYGKVQINDFSISTIAKELGSGYPVLCDGRFAGVTSGGHSWVIDGGYCDSVTYPGMTNEDGSQVSTTIYSYYFHCVWGEAGKANGYFLFDVATGRMGGYPDKGDYEHNETHGNVYNNMRIGYNIRPLK